MADDHIPHNEQEPGRGILPADQARQSGESLVKKTERTNTNSSSKATASQKQHRPNTDLTASYKAKAQLARVKHGRRRNVTAEGPGEPTSKKAESSEPARQNTSEKPALKLLSPGSTEVLVDIVAIRDYHDDPSTAWTFNVELLRRQLRELPDRFNPPVAEPRDPPGEHHEKQISRARDRDSAPPAERYGDLNINWLVHPEMLPQQIPWARIFSFEYPRQHKDRSLKPARLQSLVSRLNSELRQVRQGEPERPVVFIAHDFGFVIFLELLFSKSSTKEKDDQTQYRKSMAAAFVFLTPADGYTGDVRIGQYLKSQSMSDRVFSENIPYAEMRSPDYVGVHLEQVEALRSLAPRKAPRPFVRLMNDDGKQFKDPLDKAFWIFARSLTKATAARLILQAAIDGREDLLQSYEERGWDLNLSDNAGKNVLHFAVITKNMKTLLFLLNCKGIKVDAKDAGGQTALHYAVKTLSRPQGAIAMLVDAGADATIKDNNGTTVLDIARKRNIQQSLKTFRAITGPSSDPGVGLQLPDRNALDELKQLATEDCLMTMAEFFKVNETEKFIIQRPSVFQVLYGMYPDDILDVARRKTEMKQETRVCRWLHVPANHTGWVDGLFARLGMAKESIQVDQHAGKTYWSNYLRPHCRMFKATRQPLPNTANRKPESAGSAGLKSQDTSKVDQVRGIQLYMPFLTSERHCDQRILYNTIVGDERSLEKDFYYIAGRRTMPPESPEVTDEDDSDDPEETTEPLASTGSRRSRDLGRADAFHEPAPDKAVTSDAESWADSHASSMDHGADNARLRSEQELFYAFRDSLTGLGRPLHVRRTLDQSHYLMLEDTTKRDRDQVVLRRQQRRDGSKNGPVIDTLDAEDLKDEDSMVIVDQLWLWVMDDTVISSFPRSWPLPDWECECDVLDRLIEYINATQQRGPIKSSNDLAKLIVKHCVDVFNHPQRENHYHQLSLHDAFETSAGIVADEEMKLFRQFEHQVFMLKEFEVPEADVVPGGKSEHISSSYYDSYYVSGGDTLPSGTISNQEQESIKEKKKTYSQESENEILNKLFDIKKEIELLDEAKDVRDELRMILRILSEQKRVMGDWFEIIVTPSAKPETKRTMERMHDRNASAGSVGIGMMFEPQDDESTQTTHTARSSLNDIAEEAYATIQSNFKDFTRMLDHVTATEKGINQLLNLKQKEANSLEARFARKSAEAATKQGNTVLFFTIVTIIFGSLSFITTFFALNVTAFPLDPSSGEPVWGLRPVIGLIIGLSLGLSIPFIVMALTINSTMAFGVRIVREVRKFLSFINIFRHLRRRQMRLLETRSGSSYYSYFSSPSYISERRPARRSNSSSLVYIVEESPRRNRRSTSSHYSDTDRTLKKRAGWVAKAGKSMRRLKPRLRSIVKPSEAPHATGSDQTSVYSV